ncbi:PIN domain-containing protein [Candidatus Pacearchaeota archaeon]|nr:PIN domain-containing protein [Candidatus Pacearchaeota archaeon]
MRLVVDTNIMISAIIKDGKTRQIIFSFGFEFFTPAYALTELRKHKEEICEKAGISNFDFESFLEILFRYVKIINPEIYYAFLDESSVLIKDIKDVSFLACALALQCSIWSNDRGFKGAG